MSPPQGGSVSTIHAAHNKDDPGIKGPGYDIAIVLIFLPHTYLPLYAHGLCVALHKLSLIQRCSMM